METISVNAKNNFISFLLCLQVLHNEQLLEDTCCNYLKLTIYQANPGHFDILEVCRRKSKKRRSERRH